MENSLSTTDLTGKVALITGATAGIGFQTACALARLGATLYITGRNQPRGAEAVQHLRTLAGHDDIHFMPVDHTSVSANRQLAARVLAATDQLHILVNNVGGLYNDRTETADGYEATLALNFVGPVALTQALLPRLQQGAPARIVNVVSGGHAMWQGDPFIDLHLNEAYLGLQAYARAKLLNILWTMALARRLADSGMAVNAAAAGMAWTPGNQTLKPRAMPLMQRIFWPLFRLIQRSGSVEKAAASSIYLATAPEAGALNGAYIGENGQRTAPAPAAREAAAQERAWTLGLSLVEGAPTYQL